MLKQYEYWTREGKKWTSWFKTLSNEKHDYQFYNKRISSRLLNNYKDEESLCTSSRHSNSVVPEWYD